jgi:hypothetical protein
MRFAYYWFAITKSNVIGIEKLFHDKWGNYVIQIILGHTSKYLMLRQHLVVQTSNDAFLSF